MGEFDKALGQMQEQIRTLFKQQEAQAKLIDTVHRLAVSVETIATKQDIMGKGLEKVQGDVDDVKSRPAKRWDALITTALTGVVGVIVGAIMALVIK